jgi:TonB family protein
MTASAFVLYVVYTLLLERENMHHFKRIYLLFSLVFSMTVPFATLTIEIPEMFTNITGWSGDIEIADSQLLINGVTTQIGAIPAVQPVNYSLLILAVYVLIASSLLFRLLKNFGQMLVSGRTNACKDFHGAKIALFDEKSAPHSFGRYIFISRDDYESGKVPDEIMLHEWAHVKQWHTCDILFIELLITFGWFNPVFYLYRNKIRQNHEFLADEAVIGSDKKLIPVYQTMLINHIPQKTTMNFTSNFNFNYLIIKKRIMMMTKATSKKKAWCTSMALIPIIIAAICVFSNFTFSNGTSEQVKKEDITTTNVSESVQKEDLTITDEHQSVPVVEDQQPAFQTIGNRKVYTEADEMPEFPGGENENALFLSNTIKYPLIAMENGIQGRVTIQFIVNKDGTISDAEVIEKVDPSLDAEALRIIKLMPKWIPGKVKGEAVAVRNALSVTFRLI